MSTWIGDTMRRISVPKKWILVENDLSVRDLADSLGVKAGYGNFSSSATALNQGGLEKMADSQLQRVLQQSDTNKIVESMRSYASKK